MFTEAVKTFAAKRFGPRDEFLRSLCGEGAFVATCCRSRFETESGEPFGIVERSCFEGGKLQGGMGVLRKERRALW